MTYGVDHLSFITTVDLDGDSDIDVVTGPGGAQVLLNTGNGTLAWHDQYPGGIDSWSQNSFAFSDLDGDGDTDYAATLSYNTNLVQIVLSRCDESSCPWDLDGSGAVGITDLLALLASWGTDPGGPPDFDGDGDVGIGDFLTLLAGWGPCP